MFKSLKQKAAVLIAKQKRPPKPKIEPNANFLIKLLWVNQYGEFKYMSMVEYLSEALTLANQHIKWKQVPDTELGRILYGKDY